VVDAADQEVVIQQRRLVTNTLMKTVDDRVRLARDVLGWVESWIT
jgi:hypothetical protein